jgi:UDP-3-O-[3-hydroxymyristoyl] glucosamine N-acyltransferase
VTFTLRELAEKIGAEIRGDGDTVIESAAPLESAGEKQVSFLSNPAYAKYVNTTRASALVVSPDVEVEGKNLIIGKNPYLLFSQIIDILYPPEEDEEWRIHSAAHVSEQAQISGPVDISPGAVIEDEVFVAEGTVIGPNVFVGKQTTIGKNCRIGPNVSIMHGCRIGDNVTIHAGTVIGSDGFGFAPTEPGAEYKKIRQVGWVEIGDNVEIGANVTIDRGAIGPTVIENGVKIDNLVMIAHNVRIGKNSIIVAQVGISGSTKVGKSVILAGQVGLVGHIEIGDGAVVGAQSGVSKSLEAGKTYFGYPAREIMETKRIEASLRKLPEMAKKIRELEKGLKDKS